MAGIGLCRRCIHPLKNLAIGRLAYLGNNVAAIKFIQDVPRRTITTDNLRYKGDIAGGRGRDGSLLNCPKCGSNLEYLDAVDRTFVRCVSMTCKSMFTDGPELHEHEPEETKPLTPKMIHEYLNRYVTGQHKAKKVLATQTYNHYMRVRHHQAKVAKATQVQPYMDCYSIDPQSSLGKLNRPDALLAVSGSPMLSRQSAAPPVIKTMKPIPQTPVEDEEVQLDKSNILLLGPTGVGKTLLSSKLAECLGVPFAVADCTTLTSAGYVGEDVEGVLSRLLFNANNDVEKCETGIIFLDEIDKIKVSRHSVGRDVGGEGVQQAFLKTLEGTTTTVSLKNKKNELIQINTKNILFIASGAFIGLDKIIQTRISQKDFGFGACFNQKEEISETSSAEGLDEETAKLDAILEKVEAVDLMKFGMIPELCGRIPVLVTLHSLGVNSLVKILTEPVDAPIRQYKKIFSESDTEFEYEEDALNAIAETAMKKKTGARGLRTVLENVLNDAMYEVPGSKIMKVTLTEDSVKKGMPVLYTMAEEEEEEYERLNTTA